MKINVGIVWLATVMATVMVVCAGDAAVVDGPAEPAAALTREAVHEIVVRAYREVLGRDPDPNGLDVHVRIMLEEGFDEAWMRDTLMRSSEYQGRQTQQRKSRLTLGLAIAAVVVVWLVLALHKPPPDADDAKPAIPPSQG